MEFREHILNTLLDKYEKSLHYQGKAKVNRKIALSFNAKNFPWYWKSEAPHLKKAIHQVVEDLAGQGIVAYKWLPFEKGNLLDSVWLNLEQVDTAYRVIGRQPRKDKIKEVVGELENLLPQITQEWVKNFLIDCLKEMQDKKDFPLLLPAEKEERELLLKSFLGLEDKRDTVLLERVFSLKYLGHSKVFQRKVKGRLTRIAVQYLLNNSELLEDEVIQELGIEKNSEEVLVCGAITLLYKDKKIDYANSPFGGVVDTKYFSKMKIGSVKAAKVITIENKANFHYLVNNGMVDSTLLIYLGGFPGPQKRDFLVNLYQLKPNVSFYHWGDIDLGGFRIFETLRKVIPTIKPLFMDESTLLKYKGYCDELENNYARQLEKLLDKVEYKTFWPVIKVMLKDKIRLEQEALLVSEVDM
ncbi:conserved hypothetical protein [Desulforamulus reducens MI-1]|uniref:Wadjet protein JetD C-terminal domain-containing protein n=1 Tax=Desulforamulus reducens (strain ATCC BAA-1160 / DSM 100696 / MI-1) TaxID=349161 RepID=A4J223_DESRM|nr:DUF2220 domain-containing protein [Desulforamulus reducens]ABO49126.1 conserved hypothetical protein [Desulforamulus reducens MI-1]